jgi:DNA-3-methyladenine glycosylase
MSAPPLARDFFERPTIEVARGLLGCVLVRETAAGRVAGRIVETEAYLSEGDAASHSHRGRTQRNASMFGEPGTAYVYLIYGVHHCLNVVTAPQGVGEAVLLRALEPLEGLDLMAARRGRSAPRELCSGPGKLVQALGVTREDDGLRFGVGGLVLHAGDETCEILAGPRVGLSKAEELPLRFRAKGSSWVSR